jgi:hypothetical protein
VNSATIIGNGPSRLNFNLDSISKLMMTYGCNALYRDFMPDYLISMDWPVVLEILENEIYLKTTFYTQDTANFNNVSDDIKQHVNWLKNMARRLDSGNSALEVALSHEYDNIYMIGFDYNIANGILNNVYHGTKHYAHNGAIPSATQMAAEWRNRLRKLVKEHPDTQIVRVNGANTEMIVDLPNYSEITIEQFKDIYEQNRNTIQL